MLFNSIEFGLYLLIVFAAYWTATKLPVVRKYILIVAGIFFLGYGSKILALFLIISAVSTWYFGKRIYNSDEPVERRNSLIAAISVNVLMLVAAKSGFAGGIEGMIGGGRSGDPFDLSSAHGFLTFGVLFFTIQATGYIIDVFRGDTSEEPGFEETFLLIAYFPKFVAGPLVSNTTFTSQINDALAGTRINASMAFYLIIRGLFKKAVLANFLAVRLVDPFYADPGSFSSLDGFVALLAFSLQLYWNLSGMFDIGRGVSILFGVDLPINFDRPFISAGFGEFINRFNSTLTAWIRRYISGPLGGREKQGDYVYLIIPALFGGLWYGTGWNALLLGAFAALILMIDRGLRQRGKFSREGAAYYPAVVVTILLVSLLLVFLRAGSAGSAFDVFGTVFSFDLTGSRLDPLLLTVIIWGFAIQFVPAGISDEVLAVLSRLHPLTQAVLIGIAVVLVSSLAIGNYPNLNHFAF